MQKNTFSFSKNRYLEDNNYYNNYGDTVRIDIIKKMVGKNNKILDLGCYTGAISKEFIKNGNNVSGIDASSYAVEKACSNGISAIVGDLESKLPFDDNSFDVVFAGEVIEHILDTDFFINEIKRVLKPNGYVVITTPNVASFGRRMMLLFGLNPFFEASFSFPITPKPAGHVRFFTKKLLIDFLNYNNFTCIDF